MDDTDKKSARAATADANTIVESKIDDFESLVNVDAAADHAELKTSVDRFGEVPPDRTVSGQPSIADMPDFEAAVELDRIRGDLALQAQPGETAATPQLDISTDLSKARELLNAHYVDAPSHGLASDLVFEELNGKVVYERYTATSGRFYVREHGACYFVPIVDMHARVRLILEGAIKTAFDQGQARGDGIADLFKLVGRAYQRSRTRDFLASTIILFAERVIVPDLHWNSTPSVFATLSGIVDFSGDSIKIRDPGPGEYFRDPVPQTAQSIADGGPCPCFDRFMIDLFPDPSTRQSALHCVSLVLANRPSRYFQIWFNPEGRGAKNTFIDILSMLVPGRCNYISGSLVLKKADLGEPSADMYLWTLIDGEEVEMTVDGKLVAKGDA